MVIVKGAVQKKACIGVYNRMMSGGRGSQQPAWLRRAVLMSSCCINLAHEVPFSGEMAESGRVCSL